MYIKSFSIDIKKGSVISTNRTPFCVYYYNIKKNIRRK